MFEGSGRSQPVEAWPNSYQAADGLLTIGEDDYDWQMVASVVEHYWLSDASRGRLARALGGEAVTPDFPAPVVKPTCITASSLGRVLSAVAAGSRCSAVRLHEETVI
jgi:hypothetical protein